ncbi:hypothetical protein GCM10023143_04500 [Compostibacter hankyongensis]|uniref:Oxidoreductase molybdopterin-binding domain-containing protein n=2 Tax=Compostibacter hankyongensis TaxID=1007089 RepID=A0ABP8FFM6_9BACT
MLSAPASFCRGQDAKPPRAVTVTGAVQHPLKLSAADLSGMKRTEVRAAGKDGKTHAFSGVALSDILEKAGVAMGPALRGKNMASYLLVKAADGYRVIFALPELDAAFTDRRIILADREDGQALPAGKGPFRVIVPGEKKPARWIWDVTALVVGKAGE